MSAHSTLDRHHSTAESAERRERRFDSVHVSALSTGLWSLLGSEDRADGDVTAVFVVNGEATVRTPHQSLALHRRHFVVLGGRGLRRLVVTDNARVLVLRMSRVALGGHSAAFRAVEGNVIDTTSGLSSLVGHLLDGLAAPGADEIASHPSRVAQHIVGLLALMCRDHVSRDDQRSATLISAMEFIDDRLGDEQLSPDVVARAHNVSTRTLHRLFEAEGCTIAGWIRSRRLEVSRTELCDPELRSLSVSAIGVRSGLCDAAHFSRLFKATYGVSPRDYRARHLAHDCVAECRGLTA